MVLLSLDNPRIRSIQLLQLSGMNLIALKRLYGAFGKRLRLTCIEPELFLAFIVLMIGSSQEKHQFAIRRNINLEMLQ